MSLNSIALEIVWVRLVSIVDEASRLLTRAAFSLIVREAHDFVVVLLDRKGENLAQGSKTIPAFTLAASAVAKACLKKIAPESLRPGDLIISNDPWISTGHQFDVTLLAPIFKSGRLIGYAVSITHWSEIGGRGWTLFSRDYFEEGLVIPIARLSEGGIPNELVHAFIRENVRNPDNVFADLAAQRGALDLVQEKVVRLLEEFQHEDLQEIAAQIHARSEAAMRQAIERLPDGTHSHTLRIDGVDGTLQLRTTVTVQGSSMRVDYAGTSPQSSHAINSVLNYSAGYTLFAVKSVLCPQVPNNDGINRAIDVTAPTGTIVNPAKPAGLVARNVVGFFCAEATLGALRRFAPDRVPAGSPTTWIINVDVLPADGAPLRNFQMFLNGGLGAHAREDGRHCCLYPSSVQNTPIEIIEREFPVRFLTKEYRPGSGGAGRHRGGHGQVVEMQALAPMRITCISTAIDNPPQGAEGGTAGQAGAILIDGKPLLGRAAVDWRPGEQVTLLLPGGGGFGDPDTRSAAAVARELRDGFVEVGAATGNAQSADAQHGITSKGHT